MLSLCENGWKLPVRLPNGKPFSKIKRMSSNWKPVCGSNVTSYIRNRTGTACSAPYNFNMNLRFSHKPKQTALCFHTKRSAFFINSDCSEKELTCSVLLRSYPVHPSVQPVPCHPLLRCLLYNISAFLRFPSSRGPYQHKGACRGSQM